MCCNYHSDGQLCSKCKHGFAPLAYSYSLTCVECSNYTMNWIKYIAVAFLPLTLFLGVIVVFRLSVTSGFCIGNILFYATAIMLSYKFSSYKTLSFQCYSIHYPFHHQGGILSWMHVLYCNVHISSIFNEKEKIHQWRSIVWTYQKSYYLYFQSQCLLSSTMQMGRPSTKVSYLQTESHGMYIDKFQWNCVLTIYWKSHFNTVVTMSLS